MWGHDAVVVDGGADEQAGGHAEGAVEEAEEDEGGDDEGREVDGAVLPELAADGPEETAGSGTRRAAAVRAGFGEGCWESVGLGRHWAAHVYELGVAVGGGGAKGRRGLVGVADEGYEDVGDAGGADVAERSELLTGHAVVEENAAAEGLTFLNWLEGAGGGELRGVRDELEVAGVEVIHAAAEDEVAAVDEDEVGEDVLGLRRSGGW